ncbi:MAG: Serine/threonine protein kinase PrkC, regulator of stationary phase [Myxococcaceae bacterium]|nr:Serine/threonine protein kinase PrkC, regulator of stationary phase [Myxococcaceae bacterium]
MSLPALGSAIAGKYRLYDLLGQGGMGSVYRAHHELMDKAVALKLLRPSATDPEGSKARFLREARAAARIRHPHVVEVYDVGVDGEIVFMVMELLEGMSFGKLLLSEVPLHDKLRLLLGAMRGVAAAHAQGIIHRDIKPENILVCLGSEHPEGLAKVLDFGISKLHDDAYAPSVTESGIAVGTPRYMSSEQMHGARDIDQRTDIYAFGVILYETIARRLPFDGETTAAIAVKMHTGRAEPLRTLRPDLPVALEHVVMKAMAVAREDRYPSMNAMIDALEPTLGLLDAGSRPGLGLASAALQRGPLSPTLDAIAPVGERSQVLRSEARTTTPEGRARRIVWPALALAVGLAGALGISARQDLLSFWGRRDARDAPSVSQADAGVPLRPSTAQATKPSGPRPVSRPDAATLAQSPNAASPAKPLDAGALQPERASRGRPRRAARRQEPAVELRRPDTPDQAGATDHAPAEPAPARPATPTARGLRSGELRRDEL